jgi:hypothetical protein
MELIQIILMGNTGTAGCILMQIALGFGTMVEVKTWGNIAKNS